MGTPFCAGCRFELVWCPCRIIFLLWVLLIFICSWLRGWVFRVGCLNLCYKYRTIINVYSTDDYHKRKNSQLNGEDSINSTKLIKNRKWWLLCDRFLRLDKTLCRFWSRNWEWCALIFSQSGPVVPYLKISKHIIVWLFLLFSEHGFLEMLDRP